jgi:hypothetical protein
VPFETTRDARTHWLGEAAAVVMTDELTAQAWGSRGPRERAYEQLHLAAACRADPCDRHQGRRASAPCR